MFQSGQKCLPIIMSALVPRRAVNVRTRQQAGDRAARSLAHEDAVRYYTTALSLLDDDQTTSSRRLELLLALATELFVIGSDSDGRETVTTAFGLASANGDGFAAAWAAALLSRPGGKFVADPQAVAMLRAAIDLTRWRSGHDTPPASVIAVGDPVRKS